METKNIELEATAWVQFATGTGLTTGQDIGGVARVYIGDSAPTDTSVASFRFKDGEICGPLAVGVKAWVRGSGTFAYVEVPEAE